MSDNFNFKQFLVENKLGAYSKTRLSEGIEDYDLKGMQADQDAMLKGDEDDAEYIEPGLTSIQITNPRDAKEVAAAIKTVQKQGSPDVVKAVYKAMEAGFEAEGKSPQEAKVAVRMLMNGANRSYPDFRQDLIDALAGDKLQEDNDDDYDTDRELGWKGAQDPDYLASKGWTSKKGPGFPTSTAQSSDSEYKKRGLQFDSPTTMWKYATTAGVDLPTIAKQSPTVEEFVAIVTGKLKNFNTDRIKSQLTRYYNTVKI